MSYSVVGNNREDNIFMIWTDAIALSDHSHRNSVLQYNKNRCACDCLDRRIYQMYLYALHKGFGYMKSPSMHASDLLSVRQMATDALHNPFAPSLSSRLRVREGVKCEPIITWGNQAIRQRDQWPPWLMDLLSRWTGPQRGAWLELPRRHRDAGGCDQTDCQGHLPTHWQSYVPYQPNP